MSLNASMMAQALLTKNLGKGNVEPLAKILVKFPSQDFVKGNSCKKFCPI